MTTRLTLPKLSDEEFNRIKPNLISAFAKSLKVPEMAVTMTLIPNVISRSISSRTTSEKSVVKATVAGLTEGDANKLKDTLETETFSKTLNQNIGDDAKIKDFQVTAIAAPEIKDETGKLIKPDELF